MQRRCIDAEHATPKYLEDSQMQLLRVLELHRRRRRLLERALAVLVALEHADDDRERHLQQAGGVGVSAWAGVGAAWVVWARARGRRTTSGAASISHTSPS
eukprot:306681-Prymnesium_polylepis.1